MILLTTGTQAPFDRLVRVVDRWAAKNPDVHIVGQIGRGNYRPRHIETKPFLNNREFRSLAHDCTLMLAHAGMGSVLSALEYRKPLVMMPRDPQQGECNSDHQFGTARRMATLPGVYCAYNAAQLIHRLDHHRQLNAPEALQQSQRQQELSQFIAGFIGRQTQQTAPGG
nr:glycosyltransferase [Microbulbifer guangxiensis]